MADTVVTWLGHSTVGIQTPTGRRVLIEAWTYGNPACPDALKAPGDLDLLLITHGHGDHTGDLLRIARETSCKIVAIFEIALYLQRHGIPGERILATNKGATLSLPELGLSVTQTLAFHSSSIEEDGQVLYAGEPGGYVVTIDGGPVLYHAGDTCVFSDMKLIADLYAPTVAMLPIGDRFTMGPREAALAVELLHTVDTILPIHWGTFPPLTGTPDALRTELSRRGRVATVLDLKPGDTHTVG